MGILTELMKFVFSDSKMNVRKLCVNCAIDIWKSRNDEIESIYVSTYNLKEVFQKLFRHGNGWVFPKIGKLIGI